VVKSVVVGCFDDFLDGKLWQVITVNVVLLNDWIAYNWLNVYSDLSHDFPNKILLTISLVLVFIDFYTKLN